VTYDVVKIFTTSIPYQDYTSTCKLSLPTLHQVILFCFRFWSYWNWI